MSAIFIAYELFEQTTAGESQIILKKNQISQRQRPRYTKSPKSREQKAYSCFQTSKHKAAKS